MDEPPPSNSVPSQAFVPSASVSRTDPRKAARPKRDLEATARAKARAAEVREESARSLWADYRGSLDDEARNRLVEHYQPFVEAIVRRFSARLPRSVDRGDLATAASVGLMAAIGGFDPERGVRFESYCELRVKGALLDELRNQDWLPRPWRQRLEQHKRVTETLRSEHSRQPQDAEVARAMGMPMADYLQVFGTGMPGAPTGSMPLEDGEDSVLSGLEVVPDTVSDAPGERLTREELLQLIAQKLTEQEYRIVYLKYWEDLPMREIGELTNLSESRVCKIHTRLLERLKDRFRVGEES